MKVAVFHDYFNAIGGGEKLAVIIAKSLNADIITTEISIPRSFFSNVNIRLLGSLPKTPLFHQMKAMSLFYHSDFHEEYDCFIFSGNWAHYASNNHKPAIYYCNSPVRALYDLYPVFLKRQPIYLQPVYAVWTEYMRRRDQRSVRKIQYLIANSLNIQSRIRKYYNRDSQVIYPPIDLERFQCRSYDFWLAVNRIYPEKRIELQVEAFSHIPEEKLIIVGGYAKGDHAASYVKRIESMVLDHPNITLRGSVSEDELIDLFSRCKGLICTALEEDFGMTPLEAMASGKPVIAVNEGGFRETVTPSCGILTRPDVESLIFAIRSVSKNPESYHDNCISHAESFNLAQFTSDIQNAVSLMLKDSI